MTSTATPKSLGKRVCHEAHGNKKPAQLRGRTKIVMPTTTRIIPIQSRRSKLAASDASSWTGRKRRKKNSKGKENPRIGKFTHPIHLQLA